MRSILYFLFPACAVDLNQITSVCTESDVIIYGVVMILNTFLKYFITVFLPHMLTYKRKRDTPLLLVAVLSWLVPQLLGLGL